MPLSAFCQTSVYQKTTPQPPATFQIPLICVCGCFLGICFLVFSGLGQQWDIALSEIVRTVLPREFAPVAKLSYFSGNAPVAGSLVFISLVILGRHRRWREVRAIAFSTLFILILIDRVLKPFFDVARPDNPLVLHLSGHSFPSGHAAGNLLLYFLWSYFLSKKRPTLRGLSYGVAIALMILMGISPVYVGAHWVSDVLAGYCVGDAIYLVTVRYLERS